MARCDFCGSHIERGTGKLYVKKDGSRLRFCSSKCQKNMLKLGRTPRTTKWTDTYHLVKQSGVEKQ